MAATRQSTLFPRDPYHIPGYDGFLPQYNNQVGETFGRTTYRLLTDPHIRRSPRSVLAPLGKPRFIEDFSETQHGVQPFLPAHHGFFPHDRAKTLTNYPEADFGPKPYAVGPAVEDLTRTEPLLSHGGAGLSTCPPSTTWDPSGPPKGWLPPIPTAHGQHKAGAAAGIGQSVKAGGADWQLPKLDVPRVIQQKVIPGYAGFIPRFAWALGTNYLQSVKDSMAEFDRQQFLERNPIQSFGKRFPQTYWPANNIYTSAGLIPDYSGFVPQLRHTYALTFGNSTRKAYEMEQRRRACAL